MKNPWKRLKNACLAVCSLSLIASTSALAVVGGDNGGGNGGGGIYKNGRYMTFYSAGIFVEPEFEIETNVPSLGSLKTAISGLSVLTDSAKTEWLSYIVPSTRHQYYKVSGTMLDAETRARLLAEFERVTKVPTAQLQLFALTDTATGQTFLLPEFFTLTSADQMAILFHEAYWLKNRKATYSQVVGAEIAFQAHLDQPRDVARAMSFMEYAGATQGEKLVFAVRADLASQALQGMIGPDRTIRFRDLFSEKYLDCLKNALRNRLYPSGPDACSEALMVHLSEASSQYPRSLFLKLLLNQVKPVVANSLSYGRYETYSVNIEVAEFPSKVRTADGTTLGWITGDGLKSCAVAMTPYMYNLERSAYLRVKCTEGVTGYRDSYGLTVLTALYIPN